MTVTFGETNYCAGSGKGSPWEMKGNAMVDLVILSDQWSGVLPCLMYTYIATFPTLYSVWRRMGVVDSPPAAKCSVVASLLGCANANLFPPAVSNVWMQRWVVILEALFQHTIIRGVIPSIFLACRSILLDLSIWCCTIHFNNVKVCTMSSPPASFYRATVLWHKNCSVVYQNFCDKSSVNKPSVFLFNLSNCFNVFWLHYCIE